jgi:hypothetical protein
MMTRASAAIVGVMARKRWIDISVSDHPGAWIRMAGRMRISASDRDHYSVSVTHEAYLAAGKFPGSAAVRADSLTRAGRYDGGLVMGYVALGPAR